MTRLTRVTPWAALVVMLLALLGPADASETAQTTVATTSAGPPAAPPEGERRTLIDRAADKAKDVVFAATDVFGRVPCRSPKNGNRSMGTLPHVAAKLAAKQPVTIIAFGSSSTQGYGSTSPEFTYPSRLAKQLRKQYPASDITVINAGKGGEDASEMMRRIKTAVLDVKPDLVIWQVGTNAVIRDLDPADTEKLIDDGIGMIKAIGADLVLVDPQYSPRVNAKAENAGKMVRLMNKVASLRKVGLFPRFDVMREWHEGQELAFDKFVIADGLHMNDWGYACFAQLLGDDIIKSVGQIKLGIAPTASMPPANQPM